MNPREFILANTQALTPPLTPELRLHLAVEVMPLWRRTEEELEAMGVPPPFWAFAWAGGQALARYILDNPAEVAGRTVLDVGSGSGLVAIAAVKSGATSVIAADIDRYAAAAVTLNAELNGVSIATETEDVIGSSGDWQTILCGDMCYEKPLAERLLAWLRERAFASARVLIGDPGRSYFPKSGLEKLATYRVKTTRELEDAEIRETSVYALSGRD
ncbi:MAG TPA: methyltransferase [Rhizomicrobium sp.]|jgi:predicted nicotinamide N-methyase